jgi:hypothetical protein
VAKSNVASGAGARTRNTKDGLHLVAATDLFAGLCCENIQILKNTSNHACVCEEYIKDISRHHQVGRNKKARRDASQLYYNLLKARYVWLTKKSKGRCWEKFHAGTGKARPGITISEYGWIPFFLVLVVCCFLS